MGLQSRVRQLEAEVNRLKGEGTGNSGDYMRRMKEAGGEQVSPLEIAIPV